MNKKQLALFILFLPICSLMAGTGINNNLGVKEQEKNKPVIPSPKADCGTTISKSEEKKNDCVDFRIPFGRLAHRSELSSGFLSLHAKKPGELDFKPFHYRIYTESVIVGKESEVVTVILSNGEEINFRFAPHAVYGRPIGSEADLPNRLVRRSTDLSPTTSADATVWYDHIYSDGSFVRIAADTGRSVFVETASGFRVTPESDGVEVTESESLGIARVWSAADGLLLVTRQEIEPPVRSSVTSGVDAESNDGFHFAVMRKDWQPESAIRQVTDYTVLRYASDALDVDRNPVGDPIVTWNVSIGKDRVDIVEQGSGGRRTWYWVYNDLAGDWTFFWGEGEDSNMRRLEQDENSTCWMLRSTIKRGTRAVAETRTWWSEHAGLGSLIDRIEEGVDGCCRSQYRRYYSESSEPGRFGHLASVLQNDGFFVLYDYDAEGRERGALTPWQGEPASLPVDFNGEKGRLVLKNYESVDPDDHVLPWDTRPRRIEIFLDGTLISREWHVYKTMSDGARVSLCERAISADSDYGQTGNLRTEKRWYASDDSVSSGRLAFTRAEDGTTETYVYSTEGDRLVVTVTGGTMSAPDGVPGKTLRRVLIEDGSGDVVRRDMCAKTTNDYAVIASESLAYDSYHNVTSRIDLSGCHSAAHFHNRNDCVWRSESSDTNLVMCTEYVYDRSGQLVARHIAENGRVRLSQTMKYDACGRRIQLAHTVDGMSCSQEEQMFDSLGRLIYAKSEDGSTVVVAYSTDGLTSTETFGDGGTRIIVRWPEGTIRSVTGDASDMEYRWLAGIVEGQFVVTEVCGANGLQTTCRTLFDFLGRPKAIVDNDNFGMTIGYDVLGRKSSLVDRAGRRSMFSYDEVGYVTSIEQCLGDRVTRLSGERDFSGMTMAFINRTGKCVSFKSVDGTSRTTVEIDISGLQETTIRRFDGEIVRFVRRDGVTIDYARDVFGNLTDVRYNGMERLGLCAFADGRIISASNRVSRLDRKYDDCRRLTFEEVNLTSGLTMSQTNIYDAVSRRSAFEQTVGGRILSTDFCYDRAGRLLSSHNSHAGFTNAFDSLGRRYRTETAALVETRSFDSTFSAETNSVWRNAEGVPVASFVLFRDVTGNITNRVSVMNNVVVTNVYCYDEFSRLTAADGCDTVYDLAGNRLMHGSQTCDYRNDVLTTLNGLPVTHDICGNRTMWTRSDGVTMELVWNVENQLVSVSTNGVFAEGYEYDMLGRLMAVSNSTEQIRHIYDGDQCVADVDGNGRIIRTYLWGDGIDNLVAFTDFGVETNTYYLIRDQVGSVCGVTDSAGSLVASFVYGAWGEEELVDSNRPLDLRYRWQGRERSFATGLYYFRARWYDVETGRWLSPDPIRFEGGWNFHVFVDNSPVIWRDSFGLARAGTRALGNMWEITKYAPWLVPGVGTLVTEAGNWGVYHQHIFLTNGWSYGYFREGVKAFPPTCTEEPIKRYALSWMYYQDEDLLEKAIKKLAASGNWGAENYRLFSHNCQDFWDAVVEEYKKNGGKTKLKLR